MSEGPDEGEYDLRRAARGYSPVVASFGALAVAAITVVFTAHHDTKDEHHIALATGLLALAVFAGFLGSFGLAAIGAERDRTANLAGALMFIAVPVVVAFIAILGAFDALAAVYVPESTILFTGITAAGGIAGPVFTGMTIGDSVALRPTTMEREEYKDWRQGQWIQHQKHAYNEAELIGRVGPLPVVVASIVRISVQLDPKLVWGDLDQTWANIIAGIGIGLAIGGTWRSLLRVLHPVEGNYQIGLKRWEAWTTVFVTSAYSAMLVLILPL